ncbi:MAG: 30S ribosomal protein S6 [Janthinobacterium lividum]
MNRSYEVMFILRPDLEEADNDKLIETFSGYVTGGGGTVKSTEKMGRRRLAYTVRKFNDGFYVLLIVEAPASLIAEIERRLRVSEQVIKFITVRTDEEEKRVNKIKAHRASHVKRSALPQENPAEVADISAAAATPAPAAEAAAQQEVTAVPAAAEEGELQPAAQA